MPNFSKNTLNKLKNADLGRGIQLEIVPKSSGGINPGDVLIFKYKLAGSTGDRVVLVVRPVEKDAKTGNSLLTCVKVDLPAQISPKYIDNLYNERSSLGSNQYRTYIMQNIIGNLRRITSYDPIDDLEED